MPKNFVGNGAYKLKNWIVNENIVLERSPTYWDNNKTIINQVTYLPINSLPIELFQKLKKEIPDQLHVDPYICTYHYEINNQIAPFIDVRVREALKLGLDRDIIVNKVKNQGDSSAYSFTPPCTNGVKLQPPDWFGWTQEKRNEKAKRLLIAAGYNKNRPLSFTLLYNTSDLNKKLAIAAASIWQKNLGANVKLKNQEWKTFLDSRLLGLHDVARGSWCADYNEASSFLNVMLSTGSNNLAHYKNPVFDKLMKNAVHAKTDAERADLYQQAENLLDKDSAIIPIFHNVNIRLVKPYVGGYSGKDPLDNIRTKNLYIIKQ